MTSESGWCVCACVFVLCVRFGAPDYYLLALPRTTSCRWVGGAADPGPSNLPVVAGLASPTRPTRGHPVDTNLPWGTRPLGRSGVQGLAPPHLFCLLSCKLVNGCPMYNYIPGTFVYFCGLSISMFGFAWLLLYNVLVKYKSSNKYEPIRSLACSQSQDT